MAKKPGEPGHRGGTRNLQNINALFKKLELEEQSFLKTEVTLNTEVNKFVTQISRLLGETEDIEINVLGEAIRALDAGHEHHIYENNPEVRKILLEGREAILAACEN